MIAIRRIYLYVVAAVGLVLLTRGLSELLRAVLDATAGRGTTILSNPRDMVALNGAFVTLGLLGWLVHWGIAQRSAHRDPPERAATLRRLFVYAVLTLTILVAANALQAILEAVVALLVGRGSAGANGQTILDALPRFAVYLLFWLYYRRVAAADRAAVGEGGGAATLRRWYVYGVAFVGQIILLAHARTLLRLLWELATTASSQTVISGGGGLVAPSATALVGLLLWVIHWRVDPRAQPPALHAAGPNASGAAEVGNDARSVLRSVYLFLSLAVAVATTLYGGWEIVFYALGRLLGVERPGGVGGTLAQAAAGPASLLCIYGVSWLYHRRAIQVQAHAQPELPSQTGVRRLYVYLVSLVALATLASGAGGLLWTVADLLTNAQHTVNPTTWWREQASLYTSLLAVGLPVWVAHWRRTSPPAPLPEGEGGVEGPPTRAEIGAVWVGEAPAAEARSLARRIYLYVTLLGAVLALLGAGVTLVYQVYLLALGAAATPSVITNLARAVAVAIVAGIVGAYHLRTLRDDLAASSAATTAADAELPSAPQADTAVTPVVASVVTALSGAAAPSPATPFGVLVRRDGQESSAWFTTAEEAREALARASAPADGTGWAAIVVMEARLGEDGGLAAVDDVGGAADPGAEV